MKDSKRQSIIMTGIGLIFISFVLFYFAFSQPKIHTVDNAATVSQSATQVLSEKSVSQPAVDVTQSNRTAASKAQTQQYQTQKTTISQANTSKEDSDAVIYPLNINTCTEQELTSVDGIGPTRANAIIQYRDYLKGYTSVEQIKNIKGIGDKLYEKIAPYLTV